MKQFVKDLVHSYEEPLKEIRHHLHENPELSFEEYRTAEYIRKALGSMGIALQDGITGRNRSCFLSFSTMPRFHIDKIIIRQMEKVVNQFCP